jgi:predicted lysophospholipase L1 biosynthesis ABC-type transport system permease subunit
MALRISIGAGRGRLLQLLLLESAWLAFLAAALGAAFAWWAAPFVVSMVNQPDNPVRLYLPADWRVLGFGLVLTVGVMLLFGLAPALRASAVKPVSAIKGGENPHSRRRLMHAPIGPPASPPSGFSLSIRSPRARSRRPSGIRSRTTCARCRVWSV